MNKIITLLTLSLIASFSYAQSLSFSSTDGFSVDDTGLDTFGSTADASGVSFSGSDFGSVISGAWATAQNLSSWTSLAAGETIEIFGSMTDAPSSAFSVDLYDSAFTMYTLSGGSWVNIESNGSDAIDLVSGAGFDWTDVSYIDITTGGLGDSVAGTLVSISVVPEPSTYALIAGFAAFLFVAIRRRK